MRKNQFIAVIHAEDESQVFRNVNIAVLGGAHGVFLINHSISVEALIELFQHVRRVLVPEFFVGVNLLGLSAPDKICGHFRAIRNASAIWLDDVGFREGEHSSEDDLTMPAWIHRRMKDGGCHGLLFGGVDFKYQAPVRNLARVTEKVARVVDVVTTSGPATGLPPSLKKIEQMRQAIPDGKLAIASGMTPQNVDPFLDYVDYFLVATGVSDSYSELNLNKVRMFAEKMQR